MTLLSYRVCWSIQFTAAHGRTANGTTRRQWQLRVPICGCLRSWRMGRQQPHDDCSVLMSIRLWRAVLPLFGKGTVSVTRCRLVTRCYDSSFVALVLSRVDCGNAILTGLPASQINRLQSVLNAGARLFCGANRRARSSESAVKRATLATSSRTHRIQTLCSRVGLSQRSQPTMHHDTWASSCR